jgi:hypothetical protein
MKYPTGIDDDGLPGHGLGAAHGDHDVGAAPSSAGFVSSELAAERSICSGLRLAVARVPSRRPGATQLTSISGLDRDQQKSRCTPIDPGGNVRSLAVARDICAIRPYASDVSGGGRHHRRRGETA